MNKGLYLKAFLMSVGIFVSTVAPQSVYAGSLANDFNNAISSITGEPDWKSGGRRGFSGSVGAIRFPQKTLQLVSVTPPSFSAGCNGISWSLGGFDFIDGEELIQFIQATGQAAAGQVVLLAAKILCPVCAVTLKEMEEIARAISMKAIDSCEMGKELVGGAASLALGGINSACATFDAEKGGSEGQWSGEKGGVCDSLSDKDGMLNELNRSLKSEGFGIEETQMAEKVKGNYLWWAIRQANFPNTLTDSSTYSSIGDLSQDLQQKIAFAEAIIGIAHSKGALNQTADSDNSSCNDSKPPPAAEGLIGVLLCGGDFTLDNANSQVQEYCTNLKNGLKGIRITTCGKNTNGGGSNIIMGETCEANGSAVKKQEGNSFGSIEFDPAVKNWSPLIAFADKGIIDLISESMKKAYDNIDQSKSPADGNSFILKLVKYVPFDLYRVLNIATVNPEAAKNITSNMEVFIAHQFLSGYMKSILDSISLDRKDSGDSGIKVIKAYDAINGVIKSLGGCLIKAPEKFTTGMMMELNYQELIMGRVVSIEQAIAKESTSRQIRRGSSFGQ